MIIISDIHNHIVSESLKIIQDYVSDTNMTMENSMVELVALGGSKKSEYNFNTFKLSNCNTET